MTYEESKKIKCGDKLRIRNDCDSSVWLCLNAKSNPEGGCQYDCTVAKTRTFKVNSISVRSSSVRIYPMACKAPRFYFLHYEVEREREWVEI
jgi:hypothetical protein